jgi:exosortase E/protease (VPEID-CTERM system)
VALLAAEVLLLTLRFDSQRLFDSGRWPGRWMVYSRHVPQAMVVVAAAALVFGGRRLLASLETAIESEPPRGFWRGWRGAALGAHLMLFGLLAALTAEIWEGELGRSDQSGWWVLAWLALGILTFASWLAVVCPARTLLSIGKRGMRVLMGVSLLGISAAIVGRMTGRLSGPLHQATLTLVRGTLGLLGSADLGHHGPSVVGVDRFYVTIEPECSGYEGIGLIWVFLAAYLWFSRRDLKFPRALWLLPLGTAVIWLANALRIVVLVLIGAWISPAVALGGFHSQAGWLAFNAVAIGMVMLSRRAGAFARRPATTSMMARLDENPTAAYVGPLMALMASLMVSTALSSGTGFDALYPVRVIAVALVLWHFRRAYSELRWAVSWQAVAIGLAVFAVWIVLEPAQTRNGPDDSAFREMLGALSRRTATLWLLSRVIGSVVTVPIAEELAFRGYVLRRLVATDFTTVDPMRFSWPSFLVSSILFGVMHGRTIAGTIAGAFFALAVYRKGNLSEAIVAHAVANALIAAYVLSSGAWGLWV